MAHGGRPTGCRQHSFCSGAQKRSSGHQRDSSEDFAEIFSAAGRDRAQDMFGTDWPSPGIPDIKQNLDQFQALALPDSVKEQILSKSALEMCRRKAVSSAAVAGLTATLSSPKTNWPERSGQTVNSKRWSDGCASSGTRCQMIESRQRPEAGESGRCHVKGREPKNPQNDRTIPISNSIFVPPSDFHQGVLLPAR